MTAPAPHAEAVLDALSLTEARLRGDDEALTFLLDHVDQRACASILADLLAHCLTRTVEDPLAVVSALRPVLHPGRVDGACPCSFS
jgi:hypothetical protein